MYNFRNKSDKKRKDAIRLSVKDDICLIGKYSTRITIHNSKVPFINNKGNNKRVRSVYTKSFADWNLVIYKNEPEY